VGNLIEMLERADRQYDGDGRVTPEIEGPEYIPTPVFGPMADGRPYVEIWMVCPENGYGCMLRIGCTLVPVTRGVIDNIGGTVKFTVTDGTYLYHARMTESSLKVVTRWREDAIVAHRQIRDVLQQALQPLIGEGTGEALDLLIGTPRTERPLAMFKADNTTARSRRAMQEAMNSLLAACGVEMHDLALSA
jgi:hypothetical protein